MTRHGGGSIRVAAAVCALACLALAGCTDESRYDSVAFRWRDPANRTGLQVVFEHCPKDVELDSDRVIGLAVRVAEPLTGPSFDFSTSTTTTTVLPDAGRLLWSVSLRGGPSATPVRLDAAVIGEAPTGFVTDVPLEVALPDVVEVELTTTPSAGAAMQGAVTGEYRVDLAGLPTAPGSVLRGGEVVTDADFAETITGSAECGEVVDEPSTFGSDATKVMLVLLAISGGSVALLALAMGLDLIRRDPEDATDEDARGDAPR